MTTTRYTATVTFRGCTADTAELEERINRALATHPTLSLHVDEVMVDINPWEDVNTMTEIMTALGEDGDLRARITTHRHPDDGRDDAVVVVSVVSVKRPSAPPLLVYATVRPGPSSAQGWADGVAAGVGAITGYAAERIDHLDEDADDVLRAELRALLGAA